MSFSHSRMKWNRLGWAALVVATLLAPAFSGAEEEAAPMQLAARAGHAPAEVRQLHAWLEDKARSQAAAMPAEARLAFRHGLIARQSGDEVNAVTLMRGAAELDPSYAAPHLTLMKWFAFQEPSQALLSGAALIHRLKNDFLLQLELAGNLLFQGITALYFGLLATALILIGLHQHELRHVWRERLGIVVSARSANVWSWALLFLPWVLGIGLGPPTVVMLGLLWPVIKARERAVFVLLTLMIVAAPLAPSVVGRVALPLRPEGAPFHGVTAVEHAADPEATEARLSRLADSQPDNGFIQFARAWNARRAGDLSTAEAAYRHALEVWPKDDRVLNNLGNLLAMQGRFEEALEQYRKATVASPRNAAPHFNASQVHTRLFNYGDASDAVTRASALDFELVKSYQARSGDDLPLADQWIAPATFWNALAHAAPLGVPPALPPMWESMIETSGWPYASFVLLLALTAVALGLWWQQRMPLRACSNCSRPVCRRCAHRQREQALCAACAAAGARAESTEFGRVLLMQQRRRVEQVRKGVRAGFVALIPGFGLAAARRVIGALVLLALASWLALPWLEAQGPFALGSGLEIAFRPPAWVLGAAWLAIFAISIIGYVTRPAEQEADSGRASSTRLTAAFDETPARAA